MKVIMLKDMKGVGQRGTVIEASDGYALNFLIPHKIAEQATADKIAKHAVMRKQEQAAKDSENAALEVSIGKLRGAVVTITARSTPKGGLFKALDAGDIAKAILAGTKVAIKESYILLDKPIKQTGSHEIVVRAGEAKATITLTVESI